MVPPVLFEKKENCCACGACMNICPKHAITMEEDECGFLYPKINENLCIGCGACKKVCAFQNSMVNNQPQKCFASVNTNAIQRENSASGGIFAALATKTIESGGIVYGAAFDNNWNLRHVAVDNIDNLKILQGSKYIQSSTKHTFSEVKDKLNKGIKVLYSGTPCQIDGLLGYLGKQYNNLLTIDIVCHGVPNNRMFKDYIYLLEKKYKGKVTDFIFRDKSIGWGINGCVRINGKKRKLWQSASSYLYYFSKASIYRENCYKCKYACKNRPADITLGDFWGIEKQHPEYLKKEIFDETKGISLVIVNTSKGEKAIDSICKQLILKTSDFEKVSAGNTQLKCPSKSSNRTEIVGLYREFGWEAVENRFNEKIGWRKYSSQIKNCIPKSLKRILKKSL